jgi:hypothetical protein
MPGETWREVLQIGKEATAGTAVAATRILYGSGIKMTKVKPPIIHKFATGTRDNTRAITTGPTQAGGQVKVPMSGDELLEWFGMGIQGGVSPTTPAGATLARLFTFIPSNSLDSGTLERQDGANPFQLTGVRANKIGIAGAVGGQNEATIDFFAQDRNDTFGALTGSLTSRTPTILEGWQTRLWIGAFGATPQSILLPPCLINWDVSFGGGLNRKYTAANTKAAWAVTLGELDITAKLMLEASVAATLAELANWNAETKRLITLEFLGPADEIEAGVNELQTLTSVGAPSTGGTFTLSFAGQTTAPIAFNATAAAVAAALNALANVTTQSGNVNISCGGGNLPGTPITVTFQNDLGTQDVPLLTANSAGLTGGTAVMTPSATTQGRSGRRYVAIDLPGAWTSPDTDQADANTRTYSFPLQYATDVTNAFGIRVRCQTSRTAAYV